MAGGFCSLPLGCFYRVFRTWRLASPRASKLSQGEGEVERGERECRGGQIERDRDRQGERDRERERQREGERERGRNYPFYELTL